MSSPVVIGGTGGSGTRIVAQLLQGAGIYVGSELNGSHDAMPFARFDWEWGLRYLTAGPTESMRRDFEPAVTEHLRGRPDGAQWGWKHPHSYLLIPFLSEHFPEMRFIHVIRDGRDIALSTNRQQARHYGGLTGRPAQPEEVLAAAWWAWANSRAARDGRALGDRYLLVRFEDLCASPESEAGRIAEHCGLGEVELDDVLKFEKPGSLGRWREDDPVSIAEITAACGEALARFGYVSSQ